MPEASHSLWLTRKSEVRPPDKIIRAAFGVLLALTFFTVALTLVLEWENFHFGTYFPLGDGPGKDSYARFEKDLVRDEESWRVWKYCTTGETRWLGNILNKEYTAEMAARIGENERWNRFVLMVNIFSWVILATSMIGMLLALWMHLWFRKWTVRGMRDPRIFITYACLLALVGVFILDLFIRGYPRVFVRLWLYLTAR